MSAAVQANKLTYDVESIRKDFPILGSKVHGKPLVYLDNAATSQKPVAVIEAMNHYYRQTNANVHRGVHDLSMRATDAYEGAREIVRDYINASSIKEIIFTRGTTEAINLVASSLGKSLSAGDEVLITELEHHSNIVPWQLLAESTGATLNVVPVLDNGEADIAAFHKLLSNKTKIVAVGHVSNALGTINPIEEMITAAKKVGAKTLIDGAQAIPHLAIDVQQLDCDFYAFSGHKVYGPTGIGVLFGKESVLNDLPPYQGGGDMIAKVSFSGTVYNDLPYKFEAGTPDIAGAIGLGAALNYVQQVGVNAIAEHESELLEYATRKISTIPGVKIVGTAAKKAGVLSFVVDGMHASDIGTLLDKQGIAVRAGHHCAMPVLEKFGLAATARASFAMYNTKEEVDAFIEGMELVKEIFGEV